MAPPRRRRRGPLRGGGTGGGRGGFLSRTAGGTKRKTSKSKVAPTSGKVDGRSVAARRIGTKTRKDKIKDLEQSVGSLDRRVNNALEKGNTDLAKDLRSRQNKFVKNLGLARAHESMINAAPLDKRDDIKNRIKNNPQLLNNAGLAAFNRTIDMDFLDPTRKLQNEYPEQFAKMYPITNQLQQGLPGTRFAKGLLGIDDKPIDYTDSDMPGIRYPLDVDFDAGEGETITIDDFDKALDVAPPGVPLADQIIIPKVKPEPPIDKTDVTSKSEIQPNKEVLPYVPPFIDAEKVNPKLDEVIGTSDLPINMFNQNMAEFLADEERNLALKQPAITGLKDENIIMPGTQVSGENFANQVAENNAQLKQNVIANPELNNDQKEMILKEIDDLTGFESTSLLPAGRSDPVIFDQYVSDALNRIGQPQVVPQNFDVVDPSIVDPAAEADALATLNSLNESNAERSLFERLFDSNPDEPGTQFFNLNPNR